MINRIGKRFEVGDFVLSKQMTMRREYVYTIGQLCYFDSGSFFIANNLRKGNKPNVPFDDLGYKYVWRIDKSLGDVTLAKILDSERIYNAVMMLETIQDLNNLVKSNSLFNKL